MTNEIFSKFGIDENVRFTPESSRKTTQVRTTALCHKETFAVPESPPYFGTSRCRWRNRPPLQELTFSITSRIYGLS